MSNPKFQKIQRRTAAESSDILIRAFYGKVHPIAGTPGGISDNYEIDFKKRMSKVQKKFLDPKPWINESKTRGCIGKQITRAFGKIVSGERQANQWGRMIPMGLRST